jgi:DNA repair protein RadC
VAARALRLHAHSIILVHNHPTGEPTPSLADIDMTRRICEACEGIGVAVRDHLIVAQTGHTSLADEGKMPGTADTSAKRRRRKR